jgi:hypothetical protein
MLEPVCMPVKWGTTYYIVGTKEICSASCNDRLRV